MCIQRLLDDRNPTMMQMVDGADLGSAQLRAAPPPPPPPHPTSEDGSDGEDKSRGDKAPKPPVRKPGKRKSEDCDYNPRRNPKRKGRGKGDTQKSVNTEGDAEGARLIPCTQAGCPQVRSLPIAVHQVEARVSAAPSPLCCLSPCKPANIPGQLHNW